MKHILNIAFDFDDARIQKYIEQEAESQVIESIKKDILEIFKDKDDSNYWNHDSKKGLECWVRRFIDDYIAEWKDEIISAAADSLANKLARTKRGKELLERYSDGE